MRMITQSSTTAFLFLSGLAFAGNPLPDCMDKNTALAINNDQVIAWKTTTQNQFQSRGHVAGAIATIYQNEKGHQHFEIKIGDQAGDTIEVIYNVSFGALPKLKAGMIVEACGDYITAIEQSGPYPASPAGALVHWVHKSPNPKKHPSGYLAVDGVLYGQDADNAGPKGLPSTDPQRSR